MREEIRNVIAASQSFSFVHFCVLCVQEVGPDMGGRISAVSAVSPTLWYTWLSRTRYVEKLRRWAAQMLHTDFWWVTFTGAGGNKCSVKTSNNWNNLQS